MRLEKRATSSAAARDAYVEGYDLALTLYPGAVEAFDRALAADPGLATLLFNYGRYLLIASSRPGGQPANLQGIWNDLIRPPWSSNYTTNINIEMNYWLAEQTNLAECHLPMINMVSMQSTGGLCFPCLQCTSTSSPIIKAVRMSQTTTQIRCSWVTWLRMPL